MTREFLSLCIPTRNRGHLLRDLLASIVAEIREGRLGVADVQIWVFDNASTDGTEAVFRERTAGLEEYFHYARHPENVGAVGNQLLCARSGGGEYRWVIGDDETLAPGALPYVVSFLREHRPAWFVHSDGGRYAQGLRLPRWFADVREFVTTAKEADPETLMTAGCWSMNVFRSECFDHDLARARGDASTYPQLYGLMHALKIHGGRVYFTDRRTVIFREVRPAPVDGELPADSDGNWRKCLEWLRDEFDIPDLDPEIHSKLVSALWMRSLLRHPWRTFRNNARLLLIPGTWLRVARRLRFYVKG